MASETLVGCIECPRCHEKKPALRKMLALGIMVGRASARAE